MDGLSIFIPLPNAHLMSFIKKFDNIYHCQDHININNTKIFTLFAYSDNIKTWINDSNNIPHNLHEIIIFCPTGDRPYLKNWAHRFTQVKNVITCDELDRYSLLFGIEYIRNLRSEFQHDQGILNLLNEDYAKMCLALSDCLLREANERDHVIRCGVETS